MLKNYRLMLFDLVIGGHHGTYIHHLVKQWEQQGIPGGLDIVVHPLFLDKYIDIIQSASTTSTDINFIPISEDEVKTLETSIPICSRPVRALREWKLLCRYAKRMNASHCLIMYIDTAWLPITLGLQAPCSFSGIYFRPTLHYSNFSHYIPHSNERAQRLREQFILTRMLRHPQLQTLFTLDPFAIKHIQKIIEKVRSQVTAVHLPDPCEFYQPSASSVDNLRRHLKIAPGRKIFLIFGALTARKGIDQLLEAIKLLSDELCQKLCLVLLGEGDENQLGPKVNSACQSQSVQLIEHYKFISDQDAQVYFGMADVVLALYQRHVGMSGILLWAAAAQKPVLSSDYGLMGELVHKYQLGLTVDSTHPESISQGLVQCLQQPSERLGDSTQMKDFIERNSVEDFVETIGQAIRKTISTTTTRTSHRDKEL